jgi:hypothetical protein
MILKVTARKISSHTTKEKTIAKKFMSGKKGQKIQKDNIYINGLNSRYGTDFSSQCTAREKGISNFRRCNYGIPYPLFYICKFYTSAIKPQRYMNHLNFMICNCRTLILEYPLLLK